MVRKTAAVEPCLIFGYLRGCEIAEVLVGAVAWQHRRLLYCFCTFVFPGLSTEMLFSIHFIAVS